MRLVITLFDASPLSSAMHDGAFAAHSSSARLRLQSAPIAATVEERWEAADDGAGRLRRLFERCASLRTRPAQAESRPQPISPTHRVIGRQWQLAPHSGTPSLRRPGPEKWQHDAVELGIGQVSQPDTAV
jgi:hypothetical protein